MNKKNCMKLEQKITNSKFDIVKKSLYFVIAPIIILLVGIILLTTVGFSKGIDFAGGQTFKVYVNNEQKLDGAESYDLSDKKDFDEVYKKITIVLADNDAKLVSYQTSKVNIEEYDVYSGQAIQVTYQGNAESDAIRSQIVDAFGYANYTNAISSIDEVPPVSSYNWTIGLIAGIMFGLIAAIVYMSIRFSTSAILVVFIQMALDLFLTLGLLLICRVTINLTVGIVLLTSFMLSLINSFVFYNKIKENKKSGNYNDAKNAELANITTKQITFKKSIFYIALIVVSLLLVILSVDAVRAVAGGIMLALIASFYTSTFLLPAFWTIADKPKKEKKKA